LCQSLWYDATSTYHVLVRGDDTLAVDVLDDPDGIGRYRFATASLTRDTPSGSLAAPAERAAYLTVKRIVKNLDDGPRWNEVSRLAEEDPAVYRARLCAAVGDELATEIIADLSSGSLPTSDTLARWRARRADRTNLAERLLRSRMSVRRVVHRLTHPTGLVVALVGPDGAGKSAVAEALPAACGQLFRRSRRMHFRSGLLPRPGRLLGREASDSSEPHAREPHGRVLSGALLLYHWLDALLGYTLVVAPARARSTLVVVERGFLDIAVDPRRYRMAVPPGAVRALARLLPRPDLTILLEAPVDTVVARKQELSEDEVERQYDAWQMNVRRGRWVGVDGSRPLEHVLAEARGHIAELLEARSASRVSGGWAALPSRRNPRLYVPRGQRAAALAALRLEAPSKTTSRLGLRLARAAVQMGALRLLGGASPPVEVRRTIAPYVPPGGTLAVKRAIHPGRYLAAVLDPDGSPVALAKVATDERGHERLRAEKDAIERFSSYLAPPLRGPSILAAEPGMLLFEWVPYALRRDPWLLPVEVARGLGAFFAAGAAEANGALVGPAHGDVAPWNVLRSGSEWVLVDWEVAREDAPPFFDVFHYLVQGHFLLGRPRRQALLRGIAGEGWVGEAVAAYAEGAGIPLSEGAAAFVAYLEHSSSEPTMRDTSPAGVALRQSLRMEVSA
jgi:thymidylate kinase